MDPRRPPPGDDRLTPADPRLWAVLALALVFLALAALFLAAPDLGALIYGVPAPEGAGRTALRAIGARVHHDGIVAHAEGADSGGLFFEDPDGIRLEIFAPRGVAGAPAPHADGPTCGFF